MRDLKMIGYKLKYVLLPKMREDSGKELRNCNIKTRYKKIFQVDYFTTLIPHFGFLITLTGDLWGPLLLCLCLAM